MGEDACRVCGNREDNRLHRAREMKLWQSRLIVVKA
jgi:hypothetical protein